MRLREGGADQAGGQVFQGFLLPRLGALAGKDVEAGVSPVGTDVEVERAVAETIMAVAPGGGYILSSWNTIHPGVRAENRIAMVRAAKRHVAYPIRVPTVS